ncbi:hypothetical protein CGCF415_v004521 [Colletotrichum fructicola]|uniref:Thioredoxin domain-containing protein n=1 Tax=Colletotrichum fructicola (strain Nara gc5) TaxID=1213859 RepID=L2FMS7_COLFN|nr:uncharacterized protein CGMCC3_g9430 [Colletotrichum fructicola]KAF4474414.1 hypothetical protein CGGC5_v016517 [Colletotrichum fructicola Nara gc5]KAE9574459.1 hypothetical protein CGMCC3_g9430 [Colletotrichum fructicola]KAF4431644.1 hypothetical protein CFRS1_v011071 [Colletotrichum fructicola]KAF4898799.1 hypothetical protein CGCFRS4_v004290 [Colletotrichum fructicola]KAF4911209.1 hypothetical protein CGCF415_v004521 [Colletotrichum fructicola]
MTLIQEFWSWITPAQGPISASPELGHAAPTTLQVPFPRSDFKPTVITFLRHCGCPFAEKTFLQLRDAAGRNPDVKFIAVSHSSELHTSKWLAEVGGVGDTSPVDVVVDEDRTVYAKWGLGISSFLHVLSPGELSEVFSLAWNEGIKNRPTESGNRWQTSGAWAINEGGIIVWGHAAKGASEIPDFEEAVTQVKTENGE